MSLGLDDSNKVKGLQVQGTFAIETHSGIDMLSAPELRTLVLKLESKERGTGAFVTIDNVAFLEVDVDLNERHSFNPDPNNGSDDSHSFLGGTVTNKAAAGVTVAPTGTYRLDLKPYLNVADNVADNTSWDASAEKLRSHWFPAAAVVLDLDADNSISSIAGHGSKLSIQDATPDDQGNYPDRSYLVPADGLEVGLMVHGRVIIDCKNQAIPQVTGLGHHAPGSLAGNADKDLDSTNAILGDSAAQDAGLRITMTGIENFSQAQALFVAVAAGNDGSIGLTPPTVTPSSPDDFIEVIHMSDLIGEGTVVASIISAIQTTMGNEANLIKNFTMTVDDIDHDPVSDFSGHGRALVSNDSNRKNESKKLFLDGDRIVIDKSTSLSLEIKPFQYSFQGSQGNQANPVPAFNMFKQTGANAIKVYGVLKHVTANGDASNVAAFN